MLAAEEAAEEWAKSSSCTPQLRQAILAPADIGWKQSDLAAWEDAGGQFANLQLLQKIGTGGYADVYLACRPIRGGDAPTELDTTTATATIAACTETNVGSMSPSGRHEFLAAKCFRKSSYKNAQELARFREELTLALGLAPHPNIVRHLGAMAIDGACD